MNCKKSMPTKLKITFILNSDSAIMILSVKNDEI